MKIALAQIAPHLGNVRKNLELHLETIARARQEKADLLVFPELSLTGYRLRDLVETVAVDPDNVPGDPGRSKARSRDVGRRLRLRRGEAVGKGPLLQLRRLLRRAAASSTSTARSSCRPSACSRSSASSPRAGISATFDTPWGKMGLLICRDFLHFNASYLLFAGGAETMIVISAAPGRGLCRRARDSPRAGCGSSWARPWAASPRCSSSTATGSGSRTASFSPADRSSSTRWASASAQAAVFRARSRSSGTSTSDEVRKARKNWPFKRDDKPEVTLEALERIVHGYRD